MEAMNKFYTNQLISLPVPISNHRIPTVLKEAIRPIESAPTTIPHRPYPRNPTYLPLYPMHPRTLRGNLAWPINLTHTSLDYEWKPEHPEETHADTENVQTPHRQ